MPAEETLILQCLLCKWSEELMKKKGGPATSWTMSRCQSRA
ncbi:hypothetical protein GBAR_LOCUS12984 [Geodia barretti]|uniref:Uncharacterized protein n=1 Tax=Geodia barretti TaxID=519541 RepID=A0AA35S4J8_GEOBA|nr:hypothetical protein GBAR_LOCUS12984 [Geodia barretti]